MRELRHPAELLIAVLLGSAITFAIVTMTDRSPSRLVTAPRAEKMVVAAVESDSDYSYGLREIEDPEVACPATVAAERGYRFTCEIRIEAGLLPVELEVISSLGFIEVIRVGPP